VSVSHSLDYHLQATATSTARKRTNAVMVDGTFHLDVKIISRGDGRSATAAAAYRAGVEITDDRLGQVFDYTKKKGIVSSMIFLPASAPAKYHDRSFLWNSAESIENRKNSVVAREIVVALPHEISEEARIKLVADFCKELCSEFSFAVDASIHAPHKNKGTGDNKNHHAHILMSTRALGSDGFSKTKDRDSWDHVKQGPKIVVRYRARWAALVTAAYNDEGIDKVSDHRSFKERGIDRIPTIKVGVVGTAIERDGRVSDRASTNRDINAANARLAELAEEAGILSAQMRHFDELSTGPLISAPYIETETPFISEPYFEIPEPKPLQRLDLLNSIPRKVENLISPVVVEHTVIAVEPAATSKIVLPQAAIERANKVAEHVRLVEIKSKATAYGDGCVQNIEQTRSLESLTKSYHSMKPPRFATVLRFVGFNEKWDDYLEARSDAHMTMTQKALEIQALRVKLLSLKPSIDEWDRSGAVRFKTLSDELGYSTVPSTTTYVPSITTPAPYVVAPDYPS
jgi:hypothetical protein